MSDAKRRRVGEEPGSSKSESSPWADDGTASDSDDDDWSTRDDKDPGDAADEPTEEELYQQGIDEEIEEEWSYY